MSWSVAAANAAWLASCLHELRAFRRATHDVEATQLRLLLATIRRDAATENGRRLGFDAIRTVDAFRRRVPLTTYDDYAGAVERLGRGETGLLTAEPVRLFEPTGGTSSGTKLVPYTPTLAREFGRGVDAWIADLMLGDPSLLAGRGYWSVTPPATRTRRTPAGIPIGFDDDVAYLGVAQRALARRVLAVPSGVARIEDPAAFRRETLTRLAACGDLTLISVWNPTFLAILLDELEATWSDVVARVAVLDRRRARELEMAYDGSRVLAERVWPRLRLLSCWADAHAAEPARALAARLPHARVQPKGLLATEAFVSLPLSRRECGALAIRSHYLEFLAEADADPAAVLGAHELERGRVYSVVVTTGGGFVRYRLGDLVEVVGHEGACPLVRFVGREDAVSDWLGEKIDERHAARAVTRALARAAIAPRFAVLSCERAAVGRAYVLFVESADASPAHLETAGDAVEEVLAENFHYAHCRRHGQLERARAVRTVDGASAAFLDVCRERGRRVGDVKPTPLYAAGDLWERLVRNDQPVTDP